MIKWTITRHSKSKCIEDIKNLDEDAKWLVEIKKLGLDKMVEKVCKIFGKVDGKGVDQISIKWN